MKGSSEFPALGQIHSQFLPAVVVSKCSEREFQGDSHLISYLNLSRFKLQ